MFHVKHLFSRRLGSGGNGAVILAGGVTQGLPVFQQTQHQGPGKKHRQNAVDPGQNLNPVLITDQLFLFRQFFPAAGFPGLNRQVPVRNLNHSIGLHGVFFHDREAFLTEGALGYFPAAFHAIHCPTPFLCLR